LILINNVIAKVPQGRLQNETALPPLVRVGIRPGRIQIAKSETQTNALQASVMVYESIGERGILTVDLAGMQINLITKPDEHFSKGQHIRLLFPIQYLILFNPETGKRLNYK
jgi:ABC-type sugar transport system ATPase subunit